MNRLRPALTGLLLVLFIVGGLSAAGAAQAQEQPTTPAPATAEQDECPAASFGGPCFLDIPGPGDLADAAGNAFCPDRKPPTPRTPSFGMPWSSPDGHTIFQRFGYAGLQITTFDEGCIAQIKTSGASGINDVAIAVDELVNAAQVSSVSDQPVSAIDTVMPAGLRSLKDAFWGEWMPVFAVAAGLVLLLYGLTSRVTAATVFGLNLIIVLGVVPWLLTNSQVVTGVSDRLTTAVAQRTAESLLDLSPSQAGDSAAAAYGDAYYQVAWRSHLEQQFGGHADCADQYAEDFVWTKAYSYHEMDLIRDDPQAGQELLTKKQSEFVRLADDMKANDPACYATWSNPEGAWGPVMKHVVVTVFAGAWLLLLGLAVLALRYLLRFGLWILVFFGIVALVQQRLTSAFAGMFVAGLAGPPLMAGAAGAMMFWFYVVIADPGTAWWQAIVSGVALGIGALIALKWLGGALIGAAAIGASRAVGKRGTSKVRSNRQKMKAGHAATAVGAGAVAGAAAGGGRGTGPDPDAPGQAAGFHDAVPGQVDAAGPPDGPAMEPWWNDNGRQVDVDTAPADGSPAAQQPSRMAMDWDAFADDDTDNPIINPRAVDSPVIHEPSAADRADTSSEEPHMHTTATPDSAEYVPGTTHARSPEPSTGDRDLVASTFRRYGGRPAPAPIGDDSSLFAPEHVD